MATTSTTHLTDSPQFHKLARRLKRWRASRRPGQRIPEALWRRAARLAGVHGVSAISSALSLSYYDLQHRLGAATATTVQQGADAVGPHFIELAPPERSGAGSILEVLKPCGQRLILRLPYFTSEEVAALLQTFLRHQP